MKVSSINNNRISSYKKPSFEGYNVKKDNYGERYYQFSYPYDANRYDCYLSLAEAIPLANGDYKLGKTLRNFENKTDELKLSPGANNIDIAYAYRLAKYEPFAYHFVLRPKAYPDAVPMFKVDAGDLLDESYYVNNEKKDGHKVYNLVVPGQGTSADAGAAILLDTDSYDVRWVYDKDHNIVPNPNAEKALNTSKNYANHIGGSIAGVEKALDSGDLDLYLKIFMLPMASGDRLSAHKYLLESGFQFSSAIDNMQTFARLQQKLFAKGKNLVSDAAVTSAGLSSLQFQSILHYGEEDVYFDWFKCKSLKNSTAKLGVFGSKSNDFIRHKLVNAPFVPVQNENDKIILKPCKYDPKQPMYVQIYNIEAASGEQILDETPLIKQYARPTSEHMLEVGTHNDTAIAYYYPIEPEEYIENVKRFNEFNRRLPSKDRISINSYEATRLLTKFDRFEFDNKFEGGFYTWDANVDLAKFNYFFTNSDVQDVMHEDVPERQLEIAKIKQKNCEVQDYAVSSVKYWTKKTSQILNLYTAQALKNIDEKDPDKALKKIREKISEKVLPQKLSYNINRVIVENVQNGDYELHGMDNVENYRSTILAGLMDLPLESVELGKDILALLGSPYVTKRATSPEQIGKSRFDMLLENDPHLTKDYEALYDRTTSLYTGVMYKLAEDVLIDVNKKLPKELRLYLPNGDTSPYGKYVIPLLTSEIAKFAVMKGLLPDLDYKIDEKNGGIIYDYDASRASSLKGLGIISISQKADVEALLNKLHSGIRNIKESDKRQLKNALYKMIEGTNLTSFKMAEMIVDRAKGGLDFRFDAAKDVSNMDSLRNHKDLFEDLWKQVTGFWKTMSDSIYEINPNSYLVAEVTDEYDLHRLGEGYNSERYNNPKDIVKKFLRETGITATANYSYFFTDVAGIFGKLGENGQDRGENQGSKIYDILKRDGNEQFLYSGPYESIIKSYTFVDNHDKPRILQVLSMDMGLFYADLNDASQYSYRQRAFSVLNPDLAPTPDAVNNYDYSYVSSKAVARGEALNSAFYRALDSLASEKNDGSGKEKPPIISNEVKEKAFDVVKHYVAEIVGGMYNDKTIEADNFGVEELQKAIDIVLKYLGNYEMFSKQQWAYLEKEVFKCALDPALSNGLAIDKFLQNLPGIPTMYAGDDLGATGYETKTKNIYLKNRAAIHHDWVDKYDFIKQYKANQDALKLLRSRPALHALNDGAPFLLPLQESDGHQMTCLLRYAPDGNTVITVFNVAGTSHTYDKYSNASNVPVNMPYNQINLSNNGDFVGLHAGLTPGMEFINANDPNDKYYVYQDNGDDNYYLAHKDKNQPITLKDNTLTLYYASDELKKKDAEFLDKVKRAKERGVSFCGRRVLYNPQYNISPVNYSKKESVKIGEKLALYSK